MLYSIIKPAEGEPEDKSSDDDDDDEAMKSLEMTMFDQKNSKAPGLKDKATKIQSKIKSVAKILKLQRVLREKSEEVITKKPAPSTQEGLGNKSLLSRGE